MTNAWVQIPPDSSGKSMALDSVANASAPGGTEYYENFVLYGPDGNVISTLSTAPVGTEKGLVTRPIVADASTSGSISASGQAVTLTFPQSVSDTVIELTGTLIGTVIFESTADGTNWNSRVYRGAGVLNLLSTTASAFPSEWRGNSAGMSAVRVRCTAYTSGTLTVTIRAGMGTGAVFLNAPIPIGAVSGGNTVAAASVAGSASWIGVWEDLTNVADIAVDLSMNQAGTLHVQYSQDSSTLFGETTYAITSGTPFYVHPTTARGRYMRLQVDNGTSNAATLTIETLYRAAPIGVFQAQLGSSGLLSDAIIAPVNRAVLTGRSGANTYVDIGTDANGHLQTGQPLEYGTWGYVAGTSGTVSVPANGKVLGIAAHSTSGGSFTINGGNSIPVPANVGADIAPRGNLVAPTLVFNNTDSYVCEYVI